METKDLQERRPTIVPTLILGLGTAGTDVVRLVKRRLRMAWGGEIPGQIQLLAVDTVPLINNRGDEPLSMHEYVYIGGFDAAKVIRNRERFPEINQRWKYSEAEIPLGLLYSGARQIRVLGLVAFIRKYQAFQEKLMPKLVNVRLIANREKAEERGHPVPTVVVLRIYIITSLCGGTGAGIFLDVAHLLRHMLGSQAEITGILLMPSCFLEELDSNLQKRRIRANAFACLKELDYFQNGNPFSAQYPNEAPFTASRPFNYIYLIERVNQDGQALRGLDDVKQMVAHFVFLSSMSHLGSEIWERDVNVTQEHESSGRHKRYLSYSSFGVSGITVPEKGLTSYWELCYAMELAGAILGDHNGIQGVRNQAGAFFRNKALELKALMEREFESGRNASSILEEIRPQYVAAVREAFVQQMKEGGLGRGRAYLQSLREELRRYARASLSNLDRQIDAKGRELQHLERPDSLLGRALRILENPMIVSRAEDRRQQAIIQCRREITELRRKRAVVELIIGVATAMEEEVQRLQQIGENLEKDLRAAIEGFARQRQELEAGDPSPLHYDLETDAGFKGYADIFWRTRRKALAVDECLEASRRSMADRILNDEGMDIAGLLLEESRAVAARLLPGCFDIRDLLLATRDQVRNRVNRLLGRCKPFWRCDFDAAQFPEENLEHIILIGMPFDRSKESEEIKDLFRDYENFEWVETGDKSRIDACWITHGLPIHLIEGLDDLYEQYRSFDTVHLDPAWRNLPHIGLGKEKGPSDQGGPGREERRV